MARKDPLKELRLLEQKRLDLEAQTAQAREEAAAEIGRLVLDAGLVDWSLDGLKKGFAHLAQQGEDAFVSKPKSASKAGAKAEAKPSATAEA